MTWKGNRCQRLPAHAWLSKGAVDATLTQEAKQALTRAAAANGHGLRWVHPGVR